MNELTIPEHPAKASKAVRIVGARLLLAEAHRRPNERLLVLDPFAGVGRMFDPWDELRTIESVHGDPPLDRADEAAVERFEFHGIEIEPDWAAADERIVVGDATNLAGLVDDEDFDIIWSSPCYGNRMADHHDAQERCRECGGEGVKRGGMATGQGGVTYTCPKCDGAGANTWERNTYRHKLGHNLAAGSVAGLQWGQDYRTMHDLAWAEAWRALAPGGLALINVKNHLRKVKGAHVIQRVVEYHLNAWLLHGALVEQVVPVTTPGYRNGVGRDVRVDHEVILCLRKPR